MKKSTNLLDISGWSREERLAYFLKKVYQALAETERCNLVAMCVKYGIPEEMPALLVEKKILKNYIRAYRFKWITQEPNLEMAHRLWKDLEDFKKNPKISVDAARTLPPILRIHHVLVNAHRLKSNIDVKKMCKKLQLKNSQLEEMLRLKILGKDIWDHYTWIYPGYPSQELATKIYQATKNKPQKQVSMTTVEKQPEQPPKKKKREKISSQQKQENIYQFLMKVYLGIQNGEKIKPTGWMKEMKLPALTLVFTQDLKIVEKTKVKGSRNFDFIYKWLPSTPPTTQMAKDIWQRWVDYNKELIERQDSSKAAAVSSTPSEKTSPKTPPSKKQAEPKKQLPEPVAAPSPPIAEFTEVEAEHAPATSTILVPEPTKGVKKHIKKWGFNLFSLEIFSFRRENRDEYMDG